MPKIEKLSLLQARRLALHSQKLPTGRGLGSGLSGTLEAIRHLSYIQIDTISVVARAHHHVLWSRVPTYKPEYLDQLLEERQVFEYWSHAASYLPMEDYRFSLPRMRRLAEKEGRWAEKNGRVVSEVLKKIKAEGPLLASDFEGDGKSCGSWWDWKPAKRALDSLFLEGELMISHRENFRKYYDLTERVLPSSVDTKIPSENEYGRFLVLRFLGSHGLGKAGEIGHLRKGMLPLVRRVLKELCEEGVVQEVCVGEEKFYCLVASLGLMAKPVSKKKVSILSPFDNFVIHRKRLVELFDFDYKIECYVPEAKRKFGYFSLPILWGGELVARMDAKVVRGEGLFVVRHLAIEPGLKLGDEFVGLFVSELEKFMGFNDCDRLEVEQVSGARLKGLIVKAWEKP